MATYNAPVAEGGVLNMGYTGTVDKVTILKDGLYKLEVWGAQGGRGMGGDGDYDPRPIFPGGYGGYSIYYVSLEKGTTLFVANGGAGISLLDSGVTKPIYGGFNGGGNGGGGSSYKGLSGSGGGATSISLLSGTIEQIGVGNISKILVVAGGGAGSCGAGDYKGYGGSGGGLTGGGAAKYGDAWNDQSYPGTQTSGGFARGTFGRGGNSGYDYSSGGGGGLYGGGGGEYFNAGSGGSGYIKTTTTIFHGKTYTNSTQSGANAGNGYSRITLVQKSVPLIYYGTGTIDAVMYGASDITDIFYNTIQL